MKTMTVTIIYKRWSSVLILKEFKNFTSYERNDESYWNDDANSQGRVPLISQLVQGQHVFSEKANIN